MIMRSIDLKRELGEKLKNACKSYINEAKKLLNNKNVFSFVIYCSSGCNNMGVAICTRSGLESKNKELFSANLPDWYAEVNAAEWDHVNEFYHLFQGVDNYVGQLYETFYEGTLDDVNLDDLNSDELWDFISGFFIDAIVNCFFELKNDNFFNEDFFEDDLLLGIQFGDPDSYSVHMIENSSLMLNSECWHDKVKKYCNLIRKNM